MKLTRSLLAMLALASFAFAEDNGVAARYHAAAEATATPSP